MFENKKILFLCKETYSYPLYFLAQKWMKSNKIAAYFFNPVECVYNKQVDFNDKTYYLWVENGFKVYDSKIIADKFTKLNPNKVYDKNYLSVLEKKYTHYRGINEQILSTQNFTRHYHFRNYMSSCTYEQQLNWIIMNYKNALAVLEDFKPDVIIDTDNAELARTVLNEIAFEKKIPYIILEYPRYESYKTYSFQMGIGVDSFFVEEFNKCMEMSDSEMKDEIQYINEYRKKASIMPSEYKGTITSDYEADKKISILKKMCVQTLYFLHQDFRSHNYKIKRSNKILYPKSTEYLKYYERVWRVRRKLMLPNNIFENPVKGERYVYMPLHLIPESTTFVKAPYYINELTTIEAVSKSLPAGWFLYVKEHQAMLGERDIEFYHAVKKIPNVRLVQINYYKDPKPWIQNSQGVITITGTAAYEAALLGKRALVFGDVMFDLIDGVTKVDSFKELPKLLNKFGLIENTKSCAAYIKAIKNIGESINIKYLMSEGEAILRGKSVISEKYKDELGSLERLFYNAYNHYITRRGSI